MTRRGGGRLPGDAALQMAHTDIIIFLFFFFSIIIFFLFFSIPLVLVGRVVFVLLR